MGHPSNQQAISDNSGTDDPATTPQISPPADEQPIRDLPSEKSRQELGEAIEGSTEVLCEITTPLQLFPITITLDRAKIAASKRQFLSTTSLVSLPISDVLNVTAETGPIFGYVKIDKRVLTNEEPYHFGPFSRHDAITLAAMAQGYVVALQRNIDVSSLETNELREQLNELGKDKNVDPDQPLA